jgi:hypothetical protein
MILKNLALRVATSTVGMGAIVTVVAAGHKFGG